MKPCLKWPQISHVWQKGHVLLCEREQGDAAFASWQAQRRRRRRLSPSPGMQQRSCSSSLVFPGARRIEARAGRRVWCLRMGSGPAALSTGSCRGELPSLPDSSLALGRTPCQFGGFFPPQLSHDSFLTRGLWSCRDADLVLQGVVLQDKLRLLC